MLNKNRNKLNTNKNYNLNTEWCRVMAFNATYNNISVILYPSFLLVEETGETTDLSQVTEKFEYSETTIALLQKRYSMI